MKATGFDHNKGNVRNNRNDTEHCDSENAGPLANYTGQWQNILYLLETKSQKNMIGVD